MRSICFFAWRYALAACWLLGWSAHCAAAPDNFDAQGSGVFLNADGDVLTARHVVAGCRSLYVVKDGKVVMATLRAISSELDVAVLATAIKPFLSAVLQRAALPPDRSVAVFAEAYTRLQRMPERHRVLSNAITVPDQDGDLQMLSGVKPGASGSAVLGVSGLLLGIVVERIAAAPGSADGVAMQVRNSARAAGATVVRAVPVTSIKGFLRSNGISFVESDAAQISAQQSPAARAYTLGASVICG